MTVVIVDIIWTVNIGRRYYSEMLHLSMGLGIKRIVGLGHTRAVSLKIKMNFDAVSKFQLNLTFLAAKTRNRPLLESLIVRKSVEMECTIMSRSAFSRERVGVRQWMLAALILFRLLMWDWSNRGVRSRRVWSSRNVMAAEVLLVVLLSKTCALERLAQSCWQVSIEIVVT